jgi:ketosteroid isomerase-like protein
MGDAEIRAALDRHWDACDRGDQDEVHEIYHEDLVVEWPQSGERVLGRANLHALRSNHPSELRFQVRRILGSGELWVTEYVITYDGRPVHTVSIMEFRGDRVGKETHYFAEPFEPPEWRSRWVETLPKSRSPGR